MKDAGRKLEESKAAEPKAVPPKTSWRIAPGPALYLVATPIGNLEDITLRALRVLKEVDQIACEDTRQTQKLLNHYGITTRTISYHEHNEMTRAAELVKELQEGASVALVTDAGMPGISDPGFRLISLAIRHHRAGGADSRSVGVSGGAGGQWPADRFVSLQWISSREAWRAAGGAGGDQDFAAHASFLRSSAPDCGGTFGCVEVLGKARHVVIAREVTKLHEEFLRGRAGEVLETLKARDGVKGEITLLIGKAEEGEARVGTGALARPPIRQRVEQIMAEEKLDEKAALKKVAKERGISKSEAYRECRGK